VTRDWAELARRIVAAAALTAGLLLLLGMILSYAGLRSTYLGAGFPRWAASAAPLCVDLLTLTAYIALLVLVGKLYPSCVLAFGVLYSAWAQGFHLSHGGVDAQITSDRVIFLLGASVMIFAGLAGHLLWKILERALPSDFIEALRGAAPTLYAERPTPSLPPSNPEFERESLGTWTEPPEFPDLGKLLVDYDNDLARQNGQRTQTAQRVHRPPVVTKQLAPSAQRGPCAADCQHHRGQEVGKSQRYRCLNTLQGKRDECPFCMQTREGGNA